MQDHIHIQHEKSRFFTKGILVATGLCLCHICAHSLKNNVALCSFGKNCDLTTDLNKIFASLRFAGFIRY